MSKYKVGDKFEISIGSVAKYPQTENEIPDVLDIKELYRIKGFNALVFDDLGLDKLKKIEDSVDIESIKKEAYEQGANDAWEIARKICVVISRGGYTDDEILKIFGLDASCYEKIFCEYSGIESINKAKVYEKKQQELKVGDIVKIRNDRYRGGEYGLVIERKPYDPVEEVRILHSCFQEETLYNPEYLIKVNSVSLGE